jgi:hypothetical protein
MPKAHLNVLFHGLFVFVEKETEIEVLIPDMGSDHVYRAGEWLGEITLQPDKVYELTGVTGGGGAFAPDKNMIVRDLPASTGKKGVCARLKLLRPKNITSLRPVTLGPDCLTIEDEKNLVTSRTVSAEHVFTYDIDNDDPTQVKLGDHVMSTSAQKFKDGDFYMNLHIIAGPDHAEQEPHVKGGFDRAIELIPHLQDKVTLIHPRKFPLLKRTDELPAGCIFEEFLELNQRVERLAYYGRDIRELLSLHADAVLPEWDDLVGVGNDTPTCSPWITSSLHSH